MRRWEIGKSLFYKSWAAGVFSKACLGPAPDPRVRPWRVRRAFCRRPRRRIRRRQRPSRERRRNRHTRRRDRRTLQSRI